MAYLGEFTEEWCLGFRSEEKPHILQGVTRRIGRIWWGTSSPFWLDYHSEYYCLYKDIVSLIYEDFKGADKRFYGLDVVSFQRALNILGRYLNENYYCQISIEELEEKRFVFNIQYHPFARMDDEGFRVFWGLLDMFCEHLSYPIKTQAKHKAKLIEIDEEISTVSRIVIVYPYNR